MTGRPQEVAEWTCPPGRNPLSLVMPIYENVIIGLEAFPFWAVWIYGNWSISSFLY